MLRTAKKKENLDIENIRVELVRKRDRRKEDIVSYWGRRSESFVEQRRAELHSPLAMRWTEEILKYLPGDRRLKVLDVGCGAGFFSVLLSKLGHEVVGTDLTPEMIMQAERLAREEDSDCEFSVMDAENLKFSEESFDLVLSRNLTWTLPNAKKAYEEWLRVLKKGGILLNFDADYGKENMADTSLLPQNHAHHMLGNETMRECEKIKRQLYINQKLRPEWDVSTLRGLGIRKFWIDMGISDRIYLEKDEFYNPVPMFCVCAEK